MEDRFRFRVWHKPLKIMHYNDFVITSTGYVAPIQEEVKGIDYMMRFNQQDLEFDKQCEVMQCTGLKDKNGKLIYEGDIVNGGVDPFALQPYLGIIKFGNVFGYQAFFVQWNDKFNSIRKDLYYWVQADDTGLEVIGNKYENPELLKGGEK